MRRLTEIFSEIPTECSPTLSYKKPRQIPPYMAAVIRRHRFIIISSISLLTLLLFSWQFQWREKFMLYSTPIYFIKENYNDEIKMLEWHKQYFFDVSQTFKKIKSEQKSFINSLNLPDNKASLFLPSISQKRTTVYQVEGFIDQIFIKQFPNEFTPKGIWQLEDNFMTGDKEAHTTPTGQHPEIEFSLPSKVGLWTRTKDLEVSPIVIAKSDKPVSFSDLQQPEEYLRATDQKNDKEKSEGSGIPSLIVKKQLTNEFTAKDSRQLEDNFMTVDKEAHATPTVQHPEIEFSFPSKVDLLTRTKDMGVSPFVIPKSDKPDSFSDLKQTEEYLPATNQSNDKEKTEGLAIPSLMNPTNTINMLSVNENIMLNQQISFPIKIDTSSTGKISPHLIDTPGCKIPRLDPWDSTVKHLIEVQEPYVCPGPPVFIKSNPGGVITFNETILENFYNITADELNCEYQPIYRVHEDDDSVREISIGAGPLIKLEFGVPLNEDYVGIYCKIHGRYYEQYIPLVRLNEDIKEEKNIIDARYPKLNVILIGIDSVSKLNFLRHFPKTHAFLNKRLRSFEMNGYTKVGDNTFPNLVPLLTGQFVEHWWNETVMNTMFFDDVGFIWKEYAKRGYKTFYAEDYPMAGTFNYFKRGFYDPPTDYYFRPLAIALEHWKFRVPPEKEFCLNSQIEFEVVYDYLKEYTQVMGENPYFGFAMVSTITHDVLNNAGWVDEPTVRLLEDLLNTGALNNTMLVLFSDHGIRYGEIRSTYVGKFEERLPLMYIHIPEWFLDEYPEIAKNMQINQNRLMTLFDVHATMMHLLDLKKPHEERSMVTLGRSLFEEITPNRTCPDANIQTHWCPCQLFDIIDLYNPAVINASHALVEDINSKLEPYGRLCEVLEVDTITDARVGKANELLLHYLRTENDVINKTVYVESEEVTSLDDYMITLVTKPGGAVFEGTVRHNPQDNSYSVLGLSRINMYKNTSWCIDSQKMKLFCFCKIQHQT